MKILKRAEFWLGLLILFHLIVNLIWLKLDQSPPAWDQAAHIRSIVLVNQFITGKFWGNWIDLTRAFGGYPPLIYWIGGIWSVIFGLNVAGISFINTIFLVAAIIGVYKLAVEISRNKKTAVLAAILFSLFPVIYEISRNMLLDLPLLVWVMWGLWFWLKRNDIGLWMMIILASLTKLNGFIYFIPVGLSLLWETRRNEQKFLRLVAGGLAWVVLVGWWWVVNWQNIYSYLTGLAGSGEKLTDPMDLTNWVTWIHYYRLFFLHQVGPYVAIILLLAGKIKNKKIIWWVVATYVIFTIIKNKDFRFTLPLLPVVAVWLGWGLAERKKRWLMIGLLLWMSFNFVENSFNFPIKKPLVIVSPTLLMGEVSWVNFSDYPVREYRQDIWPQRQIISDLKSIYQTRGAKQRTLVLINREELNDNNLSMYKELWEENVFEPGSVGSVEQFESNQQIDELLQGFQAVLVPGQDFEPAPFYGINLKAYQQVRDYVWENKDKFEWVGEYQMPKYGKVYLVLIPLS